MLKRGHLFKSWKNRFFVMQGHVVKYFSDKVDVDETVPPSLLLGILKVESISLGCSDIYAPSTTLGPDEVCTSIGASSSSSVHVDGWRTRKSSREDGMAPRHTWPAPTPTRHTPGLLHRSGGLPSQFITVRA